jgi:GNAT superfamily N-acetyltransferase
MDVLPRRTASLGGRDRIPVPSRNPAGSRRTSWRGTSINDRCGFAALRTCTIVRMTASEPALSIVPANEASWDDLQTIFGRRGAGSRCLCQRYKLKPRESFGSFPVEERAHRLREQTECGHPDSDTTSGLVAYLDGEPVGWCAVEPRSGYAGLRRHYRVPWEGRAEDRADDSVWAVTCLLTRAGFRKRGVSRALARAAVEFARGRGARAVEGYPITTKNVIDEELHVGTVATFAGAGLTEVSRPTLRRIVMRLDF